MLTIGNENGKINFVKNADGTFEQCMMYKYDDTWECSAIIRNVSKKQVEKLCLMIINESLKK